MSDQSITLNIQAAYEGAKAIASAQGDLQSLAGASAQAGVDLARLNRQAKDVEAFRALSAQVDETADALELARRETAALGVQLEQAEKPAAALVKEYNAASKATDTLAKKQERQSEALAKHAAHWICRSSQAMFLFIMKPMVRLYCRHRLLEQSD